MTGLANKISQATQDLEILRRDTHSTAFADALGQVAGSLVKVEEKITQQQQHDQFVRMQYGAVKALYELLEAETVTYNHSQKAGCALDVLRLFWDMGDGQGPWLLTAEDIALVKDKLGE